jgi:hypothetical protein
MKVLDSLYIIEGQVNPVHFVVSETFKKELNRCVKMELERLFEKKLNLKKVYLKFLDSSGERAPRVHKNGLFLIPNPDKISESYAPFFLVGYNNAYSHLPKLIIENLIGDWPIIDPTEEVAPNSLKMTLEFDKGDFESLQKFAERDAINKKGTLLEGHGFEVRVKNLQVDSVFNIYFKENTTLIVEDFLKYFGEIIQEYNQNSEQETHAPLLITPQDKGLEKKEFNEEGVRNWYKLIYLYDTFKDTDKIAEINEDIEKSVAETKRAIENHNAQIGEIPKPYYETPTGLIHSFDLKKYDQKNQIVSIKIDLGSSSHGFESILQKLNESDFGIDKIEVKGI